MINLREVSSGCAKTLLLILNSLCILTALCTFVFAIVDAKLLKQYGEEQAAGTFVGDIIIILACLLWMVIAMVGNIGALKGNIKMLYMYVGFLLFLIALEIFIAVFVSVQRFGLQLRVTEWIREDFFKNYTGEDLDQHKKLWDNLQTNYECCGLNGPEDYRAIKQQVSMSCCPRAYRARDDFAQQHLYRDCVEMMSYNMKGCEDQILYTLQSDADWLLGVAVTTFWLEAGGMLLAMWVANNLKDAVEVYEYKQTVKY